MSKKVALALSGGVDSSTAAWLLKEQGYDVVGVTMCLGIPVAEGERGKCCGPQEIEDARRVCQKLAIPHYVLDFADELDSMVIQPFVSAYLQGRTPNPCVEFNRSLKFGSLLHKVGALGFDCLATGHYARVEHTATYSLLRKPRDEKKDQTYFLYAMGKEELRRVLFPLAEYSKAEVRKLAGWAGLPIAEKPDSQDICFIPADGLASFLHRRRPEGFSAGDIVDRTGRVIGRHRGLPFYTVGQRGGLGISHRVPLYVLALDVPGNRLLVGEKEEVRAMGLIAEHLNLLVERPPDRATAKIRYAHRAAPCRIAWKKERAAIHFDTPQEAVTPGQSVVVYDGDLVVGGGIIRGAIS